MLWQDGKLDPHEWRSWWQHRLAGKPEWAVVYALTMVRAQRFAAVPHSCALQGIQNLREALESDDEQQEVQVVEADTSGLTRLLCQDSACTSRSVPARMH